MRIKEYGGCRRALAAAILTAAVLTTAGCSKKSGAPAAGTAPVVTAPGAPVDVSAWLERKRANDRNVVVGAGKSFAHVTYKPEVKIVDEALVTGSLVGVSSDGHGAVFENAPAQILALKANDILLVKNAFAVKVVATQTTGSQTVLIIDRARLVDVVAGGAIHLESPVTFNGPRVTAVQERASPPFDWLDLIAPPAYAQKGTGAQQDTTVYQGQTPETTPSYNTAKPGIDAGSALKQTKDFLKGFHPDWDVENWSVSPQAGEATIQLKISKSNAGFTGLVTIDGTISNFTAGGDFSFPGNDSQNFSSILKGMSGKLKLAWQVGKTTPGGWTNEDKLNLPAGLTIPLGPFLSGIPLTLDVSVAMLIHPVLTGGNQFEEGAATVGFNGDGTSEGLTVEVTENKSVSAAAPNAMVIAFCAPRIELQLAPMSAFSGNQAIKEAGEKIDSIVGQLASSLLSPETISAIQKSPFGNFSFSNALASKADAYVQIIHSAGTTYSSTLTPAPCSKFQLEIAGQWGAEASLMGMFPDAKTMKSLFSKTYTRWDPASDFCKSV
jgi:hypothetical protein